MIGNLKWGGGETLGGRGARGLKRGLEGGELGMSTSYLIWIEGIFIRLYVSSLVVSVAMDYIMHVST